jgi:ADP-ribose pyrophosphatase YjhB (NUDIX family)
MAMALAFCSSCGAELGLVAPCACPACGAEFWRNPKPCGGALVVHEGTVLLVRRAHEPGRGSWDIPGGFCNADEHPADTAVREVYEETGLDIEPTELLGMWMDVYGDGDPPETTLNIYYLAVTRDPTSTRPNSEVTEIGWFAPHELPSELAFEHEQAVLDAWWSRT